MKKANRKIYYIIHPSGWDGAGSEYTDTFIKAKRVARKFGPGAEITRRLTQRNNHGHTKYKTLAVYVYHHYEKYNILYFCSYSYFYTN